MSILSVFSFENLSPESQRHCPRSLREIMAHPRMERTLGFHTPTWRSCRLNESLLSHLTRAQSYAMFLLLALSVLFGSSAHPLGGALTQN